MTNEDLQAIEAREQAATAGPWRIECRSVGNPNNDPAWPEDDFLQFEIDGPAPVSGRGDYIGRDADFIARAREDVPALLAEVRRLRAELPNPTAGILVLALQAENARLQGLVKQAEWFHCTWGRICPWCAGNPTVGHKSTCPAFGEGK